MSDTSTEPTAEAPVEAPATEVPAAPEPPAPTAPLDTPDVDPLTMPDGTQLFDRDYVQRLRDEAAGYRTKLRDTEGKLEPYEIFESYDPDDRAVWQEMARLWQGDPAAAATYMRAIATAVLGDQEAPSGNNVNAEGGVEGIAGPDGDALDDLDELTPSKVQQMIEEALGAKAQQDAIQRDVDVIFDQLRGAEIDPHGFDGQVILWRALNETNGDVEAAIKAHQGYRQAIVDDYVKSKSGANASPSGGTVGVAKPPEDVTLEDAFKAGREFLRQQQRAPGET